MRFTLGTIIKKSLLALFALLMFLIILAGTSYQSLPTWTPPTPNITNNQDSLLGKHFLPQIAMHPTLSGIYPLRDGQEAFLARISLVEVASHRLDVQYYIWHDDVVGRLLLQRLYVAAKRGVKVRLLLDDNNTKGMDGLLSAFDAHPNIEVRLFNPFMQRRYRPLGYLSDFFRLNRRMHNKSLTADGVATIVGGRNIGDEYFDAGGGVMFADLDVLAVGHAASEVTQDFERYWHSQSTYAAGDILPKGQPTFDTTPSTDIATTRYLHALSQSPFAHYLKKGSIPLEWVKTTLISDDPAKGLGKAHHNDTVLAHISPIIASTQKELLIVSPYFVPTQAGTTALSQLAQNNKNVIILTNSLAATDVAPVHAGYAKYRKDLLQAGVQLFELKPDATVLVKNHSSILKSSGASLHAKTFAVDEQKLFVGSFNMDPRSAALNTEMGLIINSPNLAQNLTRQFKTHQATTTYQVSLSNDNLQWHTQSDNQTLTYDTEPDSSLLQDFVIWLCTKLPIEWLL